MTTAPTHDIECLERRQFMAATVFRSFDGVGNNVANPGWGAVGSTLIRLAPPSYADGKSTPAGAARPSPRAISNAVAAQEDEEDLGSATHLSSFAYVWGQFIDHDMDLTTTSSANGALTVAVPKGDPYFDPKGTGTQVIPLSRSNYVVDGKGVRQQVNSITAFIDGSMVYGSDATRAAAVRTFSRGLLKTSAGNLLPFNTGGLANDNDARIFSADRLFVAGDVRSNENSELTALQTLFLREHNRLAAQLVTKNPTWNDEQLYQQARAMVVAEIQAITYNEYLPALLGRSAIAKYGGYKSTVNPGISNEFSTAAFRLGHSMLANDVEFFNDDGTEAAPELALAQVFFNPTVLQKFGIDSTIKYIANSNSQEIDGKIVNSVRNFLFGPPGAGGLDLASLNIARGREHGLASYNDARASLNLKRLTSFSQVSSDAGVVAKLKSIYTSVNDVDLWVGGLAEDHVNGSNLGQTFQTIVVDQFARTRDGDRFYYENYLTGTDLAQAKATTLTNVIKSNTGLRNIQDNAFVFNTVVSGNVFFDFFKNGKRDLLELGAIGVNMKLYDADGVLTDSTKSDSFGNYSFSGVQLGQHTVFADAAGRYTSAVRPFMVSTSQVFSNQNFALTPSILGNARSPFALTSSASTIADSLFA